MTFRFLHTADWQLGKQFANIPGDAGAALRSQRIETVKAIARLADERGVDAVLVAGDVFDANAVADRTLIQMRDALEGFGGEWAFIPGNHDPALADSVWTRLTQMALPANVHLALEPTPLALAEGRARLLPAVLERRHEIDDLTAWFDGAETPEGALRIGLAHGSMAEFLPEPKNPVSAGRTESARLDYLALGDWHGALRVNGRAWYSGTPETDSFRSRDPGHVLLVSIDGPGVAPQVEKIPVGRFVWQVLEEEVRDAEDVAALDRRIAELAPEPGRCLLRLSLAGAIDLAARERLRACLEHWEALLHYLDVDDSDLIAEPSEDDLDRIDRGGFVRSAVERLRARAADPGDADRAAAADALVLLYEEHLKTGG